MSEIKASAVASGLSVLLGILALEYIRMAMLTGVGSVQSSISRRDRFFFFASRRRHTRFDCDWSSDVCSSDLFYGFNDMRLDQVPDPVCPPRHVIAEVLCVQPSVTEAQLAFGIRTLAFEKIRRRLETEAPVQLFGHEFCVRIVETGEGVSRFHVGDRVAARAKLPCENCPLCLG